MNKRHNIKKFYILPMEHYILAQNRNFLQSKYKSQAPFLNIFVLIKPAHSMNIYTLF